LRAFVGYRSLRPEWGGNYRAYRAEDFRYSGFGDAERNSAVQGIRRPEASAVQGIWAYSGM